MKKLLLLIIPVFIYADTLKDLLEYATVNNDLIMSKTYQQESKSKELESKKSAYFPTIDLGGLYKRDDEANPFQAGEIYSGYAKVALDIYDGGKKSSQIKQAKYALKSSIFDMKAYKKSLYLQITQDFFNIKSLESSLNAREEAQKSLKAQLDRIKSFYEAKMATKDDVDRMQSDYDTNIYNIESIKFQILSLKKSLELKVGKQIYSFENSSFKKSLSNEYEILDGTKSLISQKKSIIYASESIDSFYYPNIRLEDTYSIYGYNRKPSIYSELLLDKQNTILLSVNFRLFDNGEISKAKQAVILNSKALNSQISYQTKEQKIQYELAKSRINTINAKINSARSALKAAESAFKTIEEKYNASIVDYVTYLDTLTKKTNAKALYESSLNDLEVAYAIYYFYAGKNIQKELK
jgi:outer membrane protein TolC